MRSIDMTTADAVYHPNFDLGDFRFAAARYVKLLIRARWKCEPSFLSPAQLTAWGLQDIAADPWAAWKLLDQAATALGFLNRHFLSRCGSGGVRETDESSQAGRLIWAVTGLAEVGDGGGPDHNGALHEAARLLREGRGVDWRALVAWDSLEAIRADLDQLPHPRRQHRPEDRPEQPQVKLTPPELPRREAARYLGVSVETLTQLQKVGLVRYRNASPPGSGKPRYRYPVEDLDRLMRQGYRRDLPRSAKAPTRHRKQVEPQTYEHLDLD
jgi:hypothetical protein